MTAPLKDRAPSPWVVRFAPLIPSGGTALDLACGSGRHTRYLLGLGHPVVALDRDISRLTAPADGLETIEADLEDGSPWPLAGRRFAGIVVTNYLHRPLFPALLACVDEGGVLIYETFASGNERFGRPSSPDFLLHPGELLDAVRGRLRVVAYEDGVTRLPRPAAVQRVCAVRQAPDAPPPPLP